MAEKSSAPLLLALADFAKGISGFTQGFSQASATRAMGDYQSRMLALNAELEEFAALDALSRGEREVEVYRRRTRQLIGSQRAAAAASGVAVGEGSVAEITAETAALAAEDVATIRANAWRQAWGHRVQAQDYRGQSTMTRRASEFQASQSVLQGWMSLGGNALSGFGRFEKARSEMSAEAKIAGRDAARSYFSGSSEGSIEGARRGLGLLSHSGHSSQARWGWMKDGSWGYGYESSYVSIWS